ncbi:MAG: PhoH family protein [Marinicaulis sp.]|nr:PhoH family protein [Marinicaulis sp.]
MELIDFADNQLTAELSGAHDAHLAIIEEKFDVKIHPRGNRFSINGAQRNRNRAAKALHRLYDKLARGEFVGVGEVRAVANLENENISDNSISKSSEAINLTIKTPKRAVSPRSKNQASYLHKLNRAALTFGVGPAGTGKTYLAVANAVSLLLRGQVERVVLSRPALEAGERIGFLPGDMKEKVDPFLRPLYDALHDMLHADYVERRISSGEIEIAPVAFMRGRTLARSAVILDEAQNATPEQMKMFLTRLGDGAHMTVTGDPSQTDLPRGVKSGLIDALEVLDGVDGVEIAKFDAADVVRHPLVSKIINAYDRR